jgi:hypothetical protein
MLNRLLATAFTSLVLHHISQLKSVCCLPFTADCEFSITVVHKAQEEPQQPATQGSTGSGAAAKSPALFSKLVTGAAPKV